MTRGRKPPPDPLPQARPAATEAEDSGPPPFGSWKGLYAVVIVELLGVILLCHWITLHNA